MLVQAGMGLDGIGSRCWQLEQAVASIHWPAPLRNRKRGAGAACLDTTHNTTRRYIFGTPYIRRGGVGAQRTRTGLGDNGGSGEKWIIIISTVLVRCALLRQQKRSFTCLGFHHMGFSPEAFPGWNCRSWRLASYASR